MAGGGNIGDGSSVGSCSNSSTFQSCHVLTTVQKPADMKPIFDNIANDDDDNDNDDNDDNDDDGGGGGGGADNDDDTLNIA